MPYTEFHSHRLPPEAPTVLFLRRCYNVGDLRMLSQIIWFQAYSRGNQRNGYWEKFHIFSTQNVFVGRVLLVLREEPVVDAYCDGYSQQCREK